jgi:N-acetylmuramoyl-L-alanine amidase
LRSFLKSSQPQKSIMGTPEKVLTLATAQVVEQKLENAGAQ